jgi:hypothetical protein
MRPVFPFKYIEFDMRDWSNGFFITFRIPFTEYDYVAVVDLPGSANIRLIK